MVRAPKTKLSAKDFLIAGCLTAAVAGMTMLAGCSGGNTHQIIAAGQDCSACHSDEKATFEVAQPKDAAETSGEVIVKTSAGKLVVCEVVFTSEDGSSYVPVQHSTVTVADGQASITLDEGTWAVCIDEGGSSKSVLVTATSNSTAESPLTIEL